MMILLRLPLMVLRLMVQSMALAIGQMWNNKVRSFLTTIGIVIGVASVTSVIGALTGLKSAVLSDFEAFGTNKIFVQPSWPKTGRQKYASSWQIRFKPALFEHMLEHCPSVDSFTRVNFISGEVRCGDVTETVEVRGIDSSWHKIENRSVIQGRPFSHIDETQGTNVCLINSKVQDRFRLDMDCIGQCLQISGRSFRIVGLLEPRMEMSMFGGAGGDLEIFVPFETAFHMTQQMNFVIAASKTPELSEEACAELRFYMRQVRNLQPADPENFRVDAVEEALRGFNRVAAVITAVAGGIVGISLVVGGVGIMNIMLVSVSERTREIGLRKAVGARPSAILLQFLVEAVMLCFWGGLVGLAMGKGATAIMAALPGMHLEKAYVPWWGVMISFGFSGAVGLIFGMFPAIKAARLDPIVALRHE